MPCPALSALFGALAALCALSAASAAPYGFVGINTATWDQNLDTPRVAKLITAAGITALRFPGGSTSDEFDWTDPMATTTAQFADMCEKTHAVATITANYGTGSPQMAAAWVAYCNASPDSRIVIGVDASGRDWKTAGYWASIRAASPSSKGDWTKLRAGHPQPFAFKNWEIGNECYGIWETDTHTTVHDPVVYSLFAMDAAALMKRVDPSIRIGVDLADQPWPVQESVEIAGGAPRSDWNAVTISTLKTHGFRPDFIAFHHYAEAPGSESDAVLFHDASSWPSMVGDIRSLLRTCYGTSAAHIGIACTECNSVPFNPGPQTTGEDNAEYYSMVAPMAEKLGLENFIWWDLHNRLNPTGHSTHSSQDRLPYGDFGILGSADRQDQPYPIYFAIKKFAASATH